jgi:CDP-glycerol glycerophosphotransferase
MVRSGRRRHGASKPMLCFIGYLPQYDGARGGILPYRPTAPGPHETTRRQRVGLLGDVGQVSRDFAHARAWFRGAYVDLDDGHAS